MTNILASTRVLSITLSSSVPTVHRHITLRSSLMTHSKELTKWFAATICSLNRQAKQFWHVYWDIPPSPTHTFPWF